MNVWSTKLATSIAGLIALPILAEALIAYIKDEDYSWQRAAAVLACLAAIIAALAILRVLTRRLQLILELALLVSGLVTAVLGVLISSSAPDGKVRYTGVAVACIGLLMLALSAYLIRVLQTGADLSFAVNKDAKGRIDREMTVEGHGVLVRKFPGFDVGDEEIVTICRSGVDPDDVHFVSYYVDGLCRFHIDILDEESLNRFFRGTRREDRRSSYERSGRQMSWIISRLNVYTRNLGGGILIRTVLDVKEGALFYYWISENAYLVAITMDQASVLHADEKLRRLVNAIGTLPHGGTLATQGRQRIPQVTVPDGPSQP